MQPDVPRGDWVILSGTKITMMIAFIVTNHGETTYIFWQKPDLVPAVVGRPRHRGGRSRSSHRA
jgi:hypothetical protein